MIKSVIEIPDLQDKRVLVRVDWSDGEEFNIKACQLTLRHLADSGAKIIVATHLDEGNDKDLRRYVPEDTKIISNLRDDPREEANSEKFAQELAGIADIYVNEAFSVSHRNHASIVGVPKFLPSFAGLRFVEEVEKLSQAFNPPHPFLFILGGAKPETKLPVAEKFLDIADSIFIGGTLAKEASEMPWGKSQKIIFPMGDISAIDANAETIENLKLKIENSKFVLWNGPLGNYEKGFREGTIRLAQILATCGERSRTIVGGGDTLAAINELNLYDKFTFVSTGGGAMLEFLATGTLPGIEALK